MPIPKTLRQERMYREYMDFFDKAERTRRWNPLSDLPWEELDKPAVRDRLRTGVEAEDLAVCLETFCGVELFIPDYTKEGLNSARDIFGQGWFHLCWGYEESKHALSFREYLVRSGLRTREQYQKFEDDVLAAVWQAPYTTYRQMACYGALQEIATYLIYEAQKTKYAALGDRLLSKMFQFISRDEAAHTVFYRNYLLFEFEEDRTGTEEDLAFVVSQFEMPGVRLVPDFMSRLRTDGVGISSKEFMRRGIMPTLRKYGMDRRTMVRALARRRQVVRPREPLAAAVALA